jgi:hypothetical protein
MLNALPLRTSMIILKGRTFVASRLRHLAPSGLVGPCSPIARKRCGAPDGPQTDLISPY